MNRKLVLAVSLVVVVAAVATTAIVLWPSISKKAGSTQTDKTSSEDEKVDESKRFGFESLKINGTYVSTDVFSQEYEAFYNKYKTNGEMLQKTDEERNDIFLDKLIEKVVLEDYFANKSGVKVTDEEVDTYVKKYVAPRYSDNEEQASYFEVMGFANEADMKNNIKDYLLKQQVYYTAAQKFGVTITDEERKQKYEEHKISNKKVDIKNILIKIDDKRTKEQAQELANTIYTKLKNGEDFGKLAKEYSDDSDSKDNGGQKKNVLSGNSETDYDNAVFNAKDGQLLEPIYLAKGYEIVYVDKSINFYHPENELVETVIVEKFLNDEKYKQWYESIKKDYKVEITNPAFNAYKAYNNKNYEEAGKLYQEAYSKTKDLTYIDRACDSYSLSQNWTELIKVSKIGYKAQSDNVLYYVYEAKGIYKSGNTEEGLKKMKEAESKANAKDSVYILGVISNTYNELGLADEAARLNAK